VELRAGSPNELIVRDDGRGLPQEFDPAKDSGLGFELVLGMSRQIRAETQIETDPAGGTRTTIRFRSLASSKPDYLDFP
jgi:two-component sensor histidine kinase